MTRTVNGAPAPVPAHDGDRQPVGIELAGSDRRCGDVGRRRVGDRGACRRPRDVLDGDSIARHQTHLNDGEHQQQEEGKEEGHLDRGLAPLRSL